MGFEDGFELGLMFCLSGGEPVGWGILVDAWAGLLIGLGCVPEAGLTFGCNSGMGILLIFMVKLVGGL